MSKRKIGSPFVYSDDGQKIIAIISPDGSELSISSSAISEVQTIKKIGSPFIYNSDLSNIVGLLHPDSTETSLEGGSQLAIGKRKTGSPFVYSDDGQKIIGIINPDGSLSGIGIGIALPKADNLFDIPNASVGDTYNYPASQNFLAGGPVDTYIFVDALGNPYGSEVVTFQGEVQTFQGEPETF